MRVTVVTTLALVAIIFSILGPSPTAAKNTGAPSTEAELLEPIVRRHARVLPLSVCADLIRLGEAKGFTVDVESIDADEEHHSPSQSIEVFERDDGITSPAIWAALEPWIPHLTELVKRSIDKRTDRLYYPDKLDRTPHLGWVFFRKYSPSSDRKSLKIHVDSNMHTLNIALNGHDDYEGGGVFYVKPPRLQPAETPDGRPEIPVEYMSYDWLHTVKRENTSDLVFPALDGGDVLIHNFTVWHAVAPLKAGTRYSFVLFYDMDNPAIQEDFDHEEDEDALPVEFHNGMPQHVDLAYVYETEEGEAGVDVIEENIPPLETVGLHSYPGHMFQALIHGTETPVCEFVIREEQTTYTIARTEAAHTPREEL